MDVNAEKFAAHVTPVKAALTGLLEAADAGEQKWGWMPNAESQAMSELASEKEFAGTAPWGSDPVQQAHNLPGMLLYVAHECARGVVQLLSSDKTPVYSYIVLARGALEQAGRAWTLLDPTITVHLRVARVMNERLYSLAQQERLPISTEDKKRAKERHAALLEEARKLNFEVLDPPALVERRLRQTALIRALLGSGGDKTLGALVYGLYSAVAHGTALGLTQQVELEGPGKPTTPGVTWGAVVSRSSDVVSVLSAVIVGMGTAYGARNQLFGWTSDRWNRAYMNALAAARAAMPNERTLGGVTQRQLRPKV